MGGLQLWKNGYLRKCWSLQLWKKGDLAVDALRYFNKTGFYVNTTSVTLTEAIFT